MEPEPAGFKGAVMRRIERAYDRSVQTGSGWLQLALGTGVSFLVVIVLGVAGLWSIGLDSPALWALQQQAGVWLQLYLQDAYPNLLAAGWLLTGALVVAILGVVSSVPRRRRA